MESRKRIVYLDDHPLFQNALFQRIDPEQKKYLLVKFRHADQAWLYIKNCLDEKVTIDLIITDFFHCGADGYEFARAVRIIEKAYHIRLPILIITMQSSKLRLVEKGLQENFFDSYVNKSAMSFELDEAIEQLLKTDSN
jgi:DNA-binding NarL/FixJ family response regulator